MLIRQRCFIIIEDMFSSFIEDLFKIFVAIIVKAINATYDFDVASVPIVRIFDEFLVDATF